MAQLISVRLVKSDHQPLGFRLQGGKDFGTPLVIQKVNGGSAAESAGLQAGDAVIRVNTTDVYNLRHQEAQDAIRASGQSLELTVQRGGGTWRPSVTPTGSLPRPGKILGAVSPVTKTSLKASPQPSQAFGSGHNSVAKPFNYMNGSGDSTMKSIVNKQYNTPVGMYSDATIAETLSAQTEVLAGGVLGVNFKKNEKSYDAEKSAVFKMLQEDSNDPEPEVNQSPIAPPISGLRHVAAPAARPDAPINNTGGLPPGQNICEECERLIIGVFVRIKNKNLHVECFKCATCGSSLKNQGYYNLNGKLYCDIHAKLVARQNPPAPNLEPVTVAPGGKFPSGTYSAPLSAHTTPLPPLATTNYSNGGSSLFSPASNLSGPKPFGSPGSAYSPSLSPRSAPISPAARPLPTHQTHLAPAHMPAHVPAPAPTSDNTTSSIKPEYKSAAEERLIKKMAKIALNGYEIGIQRKIKPGDHLQSMANKIQDTIVTKHPLNSGDSPDDERIGVRPILKNGQGSPERTTGQHSIKTPTFKNNCNEYERTAKLDENIHNIGDKIKDTIVNKHPSNKYSTNQANNFLENKANKFSNIGDKIKDTIVNKHPSDMYSTNNDNYLYIQEDKPTFPNSDNDKHIDDKDIPSTKAELQNHVHDSDVRAKFMTTILTNASTQDISKPDNINDKSLKSTNFMSSYNNGLLTTNTPKPFQQDSNVKATIMAIEKNDTLKEAAHQNSPNNTLKFSTNIKHNFNTLPKNTTSRNIEATSTDTWKENFSEKPTQYNAGSQDLSNNINSSQHKTMYATIPMTKGNDLTDNSLYTFKNSATNGTNRLQESQKSHSHNGGKRSDDDRSSSEDMKEESLKSETVTDSNTDTVVKMRNKKRDTALDGGKRDSHIIARPISTMASLDCADGMYPVCHVDDKAITRGPFITALGRIWCPDHFICVNASCRRPLQDIGFVEENGQLYCEYCFEQFIAPACDKCHAKIKGDCLNAIGKHFHPECFNCVYCGKLFGNNPFFLEDGLPYCEADWNELFTTKCFACGFPVEAGDRWVEALNNNYHSQCFNCTMCKKNLEGQSFFAKGGRPFCKNHAR